MKIGLIVTGQQALQDFKIFVATLTSWHPNAELYVYTDSKTDVSSVKWSGPLHIKAAMDGYAGKSRAEMEALPGRKYDSLFKDYTYEKAAVLEWMFADQTDAEGAWFLDADITLLAPLPQIPETTQVALSPHYIRQCDTALYGKYNAGFMWFKSVDLLETWRQAAPASRFFEQAALEVVAAAAGPGLYEFPIQVNFGWWRMFQSPEAPPAIQAKFSVNRTDKGIGIRYDGQPLQSVHTHWKSHGDRTMLEFNNWFKAYLTRFKMHKPIANLMKTI
jgi:hypothetical protein